MTFSPPTNRARIGRSVSPREFKAITIVCSVTPGRNRWDRRLRFGAVVVTLAVALMAPASAQEPVAIGHVLVLSGSAFVVRGDETMSASLGQQLFQSDRLRTGTDGRIGVTLADGTRLSLDVDSEVALVHFSYVPSEGRLGFVGRIIRGVVAYVSGHIAKLSPDAVRLETPTATIGIRGTTLVFRVATR